MAQMERLFEEEQENSDPAISVKGNIKVTHAHVRSCIDGLVRGVQTSMQKIEESILNKVVSTVSDTFVLIADVIHKIAFEQELTNAAGAELPIVLPHQLIVYDMHTLLQHLNLHQIRLERRSAVAEIFKIDEEFGALRRGYRIKPQLKTILD